MKSLKHKRSLLFSFLFFSLAFSHKVMASESEKEPFKINYKAHVRTDPDRINTEGALTLPKGGATKVGEVIQKIQRACGNPGDIEGAKLMFRRKILKKEKPIEFFEILSGSTLHFFARKKKGVSNGIAPLKIYDEKRKIDIKSFMRAICSKKLEPRSECPHFMPFPFGYAFNKPELYSISEQFFEEMEALLIEAPKKPIGDIVWVNKYQCTVFSIHNINIFLEEDATFDELSIQSKNFIGTFVKESAKQMNNLINLVEGYINNGGLSTAKMVLNGYFHYFGNKSVFPSDIENLIWNYLCFLERPCKTYPLFNCENARFYVSDDSLEIVGQVGLKEICLDVLKRCNESKIHPNIRYIKFLFVRLMKVLNKKIYGPGKELTLVDVRLEDPNEPRFDFHLGFKNA